MPVPTKSATTTAGFSLALVLVFAARALQSGTSLVDVAAIVLFVAGWIALPGWAFYASRRGAEEDGLFFLGMVLASGFALEALAYTLLRVIGVPGAFALWPLVALPAIVRSLRAPRARPAHPEQPGLVHLVPLLVLLAFVAARTELKPAAAWFSRDPSDQLFHLANAAELANHWPLHDPRVATLPLVYHFLGYTLATGAHQVLGVGLPELVLRAGTLLAPMLLALQVWNCARTLCKSTAAGTAALLLLFVGSNLTPTASFFSPSAEMLFNASPSMENAIYLSKTSPGGMMLFASLVPLIGRYLARGEGLATGCVLAGALSGMKGSIAPVLLAGLALDAFVRVFLRHPWTKRALIQLGALTLSCAVFVFWLSLCGGQYASTMFRVEPLAAVQSSGMYLRVLKLNGWARDSEPLWLPWALLLPWLALVLGPALIGAIVHVRRLPALALEQLWLWGTLLAGLALALALSAPGSNELFFLHPGQMLLVMLGAGVLVAPFCGSRRGDRWRAAGWLLLCAPWLVGGALRLGTSLHRESQQTEGAAAPGGAGQEMLTWIREHTDPGALILLESDSLFVSALAERRCFHESIQFVPANIVSHWHLDPRGWRLKASSEPVEVDPDHLRARVVAGEKDALEELSKRVGGTKGVYLLFDLVRSPAREQIDSHSERVFGNAGFEVWRVKQ